MSDPQYIIGIDLGTTNSIVAYTEAALEKGQSPDIRVLDIPQVVAPRTIEKRSLLPSFLYLPSAAETADGALDLPWAGGGHLLVGQYARARGAEVPQRVVASAKSWLCNTAVDRNKAILPWEAPEEVDRISPVEASAAIIEHIKNAWNHEMAAGDQALAMEQQAIYLTVPASFDAVARELTVQAAALAGLTHITLLEEPQAAFYSWIEVSGDQWRTAVEKGDLVFICDIGGGTSDFSLIRVSESDGELVLDRTAVGEHLLVGGDNMDLALAYHIFNQMAQSGTRLDSWQMRGLVHGCRNAKENIYARPDTESWPVTILGRGSSLIGGTIKTELAGNDVESVLLDGFFPKCEASAQPVAVQRAGLQEAGLVYESDPAVTRHIAAFLNRQTAPDAQGPEVPDAVLFNGGVMKAETIRQRIKDVLGSWSDRDAAVREINTESYDLAVARGAAYYGQARRGYGIRIRGGLNQSYYIGIAASMPAVPGMPAPVKALCVAPFGMEEGTEAHLTDREFVLVVGEPVRFEFFGSTIRKEDPAGAVIEDFHDEIELLTTLETTLDGPYGTSVRVNLEIRATEIGTLEIWCVSVEDGTRWKLEFNVREQT
ncbi:MAG: Hsp70 family protein [Thermodesulfobacteriota bacterium]